MRKLRTILTILGIGVALELVILMTTTVDFIDRGLQGELAKYTGQMYVRSQAVAGYAGQEFPPISSSLKEKEALQIIREVAGRVDDKATMPIAFRQLAPPPWPGAPPEALAVGVEPAKIRAYIGDGPTVKDGVLSFSGSEAREVILGPFASSFFGDPNVGEEITIAGEQLQVVGLLEGRDEADRVTAPVVLMPIKIAQEVFNQPSSVSALLVTASRVSDVAPLAEYIREMHPKLTILTQEEIAENIDTALEGTRFFFNLINYTTYVVAAVVVLIVMVMAVAERTREIGTLRAIVGSRWLVLRTIVFEAMLIGLMGGILSIPIAFLLDWAIGFGLRETAEAWGITQVVLAAVFLSVVAALFPAWRATRIDPIEALRYE
ncbi:ABC transporter permease [Chloroflexota bacterium]